MKATQRYDWNNNYVSDDATLDLYEFESIELSINENGQLVATSVFDSGTRTIAGATWKVKGFMSYAKDFADFKIETLAK